MDKPAEYTLHFFPFSLYSLIARLGLVLGNTLDPGTAPNVEIKLVNLHREENISEPYLTQVNSKGQVPSLTSTLLPSALTDSHDILNWLSEQRPVLIPEKHRETIDRLMGKFYAFHMQALMLRPEDQKYGIPNQAAAQLERSDISEEHRRALEKKSIFHDTTKSGILDGESIEKVKDLAADFGTDLGQVYEEHGKTGPWLFGERPTIIDAPATAFIARLFDIKQEDLVPETARAYGRAAMATSEWEQTTHGRGTQWNPSMGHVADLQPL